MFYPRTIYPTLEKELIQEEVTVVTGMRRVGKTSILQQLFEKITSTNKVLLDLENPMNRKLFEEEDYDKIWRNIAEFGINQKEKAYIFLDEIQYLPSISSVMKYFYDHWKTKFVVTGSSSFYLKNLFPESLAGRKLVFEMFPLTFSEFLGFKGVTKEIHETFNKKADNKSIIRYSKYQSLFEEYIHYGGFPGVVLETDLDRKQLLLEQIFTSYFEIDVKGLADFRNLSQIRDVILLLVQRVGSKLDVTKLSSELGITRATVYEYLSFLEHTYFIHLVKRFSSSIDRQAAGSMKLYLCDVGIANTIGKISLGQAFEQSVYQSLQPNHDITYMSKPSGAEIDFILDKQIALEAKLSPSKRDITTLASRAKSIQVPEYYVVSNRFVDNTHVVSGMEI